MFQVYLEFCMYEDAVLNTQKRISIYKVLYSEENDSQLLDMAMLIAVLGKGKTMISKYDDALIHYKEAENILKRITESKKNDLRIEVEENIRDGIKEVIENQKKKKKIEN